MRSSKEYDDVVKVIIDIYLDYDIKVFPIDLEDVCRRLGVSLVPYSECGAEAKSLLLKKTTKGFFVRGTHENTPTIYYNDYEVSDGEMRYTIAHEIKHYVYDECSEDSDCDDLADYFARFFMCPIPYLMVMGITSATEIVSHCKVTLSAANNASSNVNNRILYRGYEIYDHEDTFLEHLVPIEFEIYKKEHFNPTTGRWLN